MALISCGECGNQVSDKAAACPKCGNPIAAQAQPRPSFRDLASAPDSSNAVDIRTRPGEAVTTEATGKGPKLVSLVGVVVMATAAVIAFVSQNLFLGGSVLAFGLLVYTVGQFLAWWHHG